MRQAITLYNAQQAHTALINTVWPSIKALLTRENAPRLIVEVREEKRSDAQNKRLWAMLGDIAKQVDWHGQKLSADDWKTMFSASLKKQRVVPGIDGGFVVMGLSTSKMTRSEMCDLQELMSAFGAERGVVFHD